MIPSKLQPTKLSFAVFFPAQEFGDKITLTGRLREAAEGVFDGEPMILPIPAHGGPPDVPRIQLEARDKSLVLQLSAVRLSLEWNKRGPAPIDWAEASEKFQRTLGNVLRVFAGEYARPTRFAYAPQFVYGLGRSVNEYLTTEFIQPGRIQQAPFSCKIGLMDQLTLGGRPVHLWMNLASARHQHQMDRDDVLVIQFDLRSAADDPRGLNNEEILAALEESEAQMAERIRSAFVDLFAGGDG